jgi:hypothetical protein
LKGEESRIGTNIRIIDDTKKGTGGSLVKCKEYLKDAVQKMDIVMRFIENVCNKGENKKQINVL